MCAVVFANFTNYSQTQITAKITYIKEQNPFISKISKKADAYAGREMVLPFL